MQDFPSLDQFRQDAAKRQAEFFGQFQQTATKVAKRGALAFLGLAVVNAVFVLAMFAGALAILLGMLRLFNII